MVREAPGALHDRRRVQRPLRQDHRGAADGSADGEILAHTVRSAAGKKRGGQAHPYPRSMARMRLKSVLFTGTASPADSPRSITVPAKASTSVLRPASTSWSIDVFPSAASFDSVSYQEATSASRSPVPTDFDSATVSRMADSMTSLASGMV